MRGARVIITARNERWAREAARKMTGFATSVIACKCEAAIERELAPHETPDGRPGVSVLLFTMDSDSLPKRLIERIGQTVLTCPTTACFDGLPRCRRAHRGREAAAHLRRRIPGQQGDRRPALLAHSGNGRRVSRQESFGKRRRASAAATSSSSPRARMRRSRRRRPRWTRCAARPASSCRFPAASCAAAAKWARKRYKRHDRVDQRRLRAHAARAHADVAARGRELGARDRARRPRLPTSIATRDARGHRRRVPPGRALRSPPATTAASSARTTSICARS